MPQNPQLNNGVYKSRTAPEPALVGRLLAFSGGGGKTCGVGRAIQFHVATESERRRRRRRRRNSGVEWRVE